MVRGNLGPGARLDELASILRGFDELIDLTQRAATVVQLGPPRAGRRRPSPTGTGVNVVSVRYENPFEIIVAAIPPTLLALAKLIQVINTMSVDREAGRIRNLRARERLRVEAAIADQLEASMPRVLDGLASGQDTGLSLQENTERVLGDIRADLLVDILRVDELEVWTEQGGLLTSSADVDADAEPLQVDDGPELA